MCALSRLVEQLASRLAEIERQRTGEVAGASAIQATTEVKKVDEKGVMYRSGMH